MSSCKSTQCIGLVLLMIGFGYLQVTEDEQEYFYSNSECQDLFPWSYGLTAWIFAFGSYLILIGFPLSIFDKVLIGHVFTFRESFAILLSIAALGLAVELTYYYSENCRLLSELIKTFLYLFWGTIGCTCMIICNLIESHFEHDSNNSYNSINTV